MRKIILGLSLAIFTITAVAQTPFAQKALPVDTTIIKGRLSNGLTYYIKQNKKPEKLVNMYIANNVGAMQEDDHQNGLAHFLEHMAFNGTKNLPNKSLLNYLESVGVTFGRNVNAYTALEKTVYMLSDVPVSRESIIDSALLVLHDWAHYISLVPEEVDKERGVIREEIRTGSGVGRRMYDRTKAIQAGENRYKYRNVIGTDEGIRDFKYEDLFSFYNEWYRPDLQAIIVAGDIDPKVIEAKIKARFSSIPMPENARKKERVEIPDYTADTYTVLTDPEQTSTSAEIFMPIRKTYPGDAGTYNEQVKDILSMIAMNTFWKRCSDISKEQNPPFNSAYAYNGRDFSSAEFFNAGVSTKDGELARGVTELIAQIEKLKKYGVTQSEFDGQIIELKTYLESSVKKEVDKTNGSYIDIALDNFFTGQAMMTAQQKRDFVDYEIIPVIDRKAVNENIRNIIPDKHIAYVAMVPDKQESKITQEQLRQAVDKGWATDLAAPVEEKFDNILIKKAIKPGQISKTSKDALGNTVFELSNGAKVVIRPTEFAKDQISMSGERLGGANNIDVEDIYSARLLGSVVNGSGLGDFTSSQLNKALTGKNAYRNFSITATHNTVYAGSGSKLSDVETMLQMVYLSYIEPRFDETIFQNVLNQNIDSYKNLDNDINRAFSDSINALIGDVNDPRVITYRKLKDNIHRANLSKIKEIYTRLFDGVDGMTFYMVGDIDVDSLKPLLEKYIASLPRGEKMEYIASPSPLKGTKVVSYERKQETPKCCVFIYYYGTDLDYTVQNDLIMNYVRDILRLRYTEIIREDKGATYGVRVSSVLTRLPTSNYQLYLTFDTNDKQVREMVEIVDEQLNLMAQGVIKPEDFQKTQQQYVKNFEKQLKENQPWMFWTKALYNDQINYPSDYMKTMLSITPEKIAKVAKKIVQENNRRELVMMPEKTTKTK